MPSLVIPELHARIKIKPVTGTWRVILPHRNPAWYDVAAIPHETYAEARDAALLWAEVLTSKARANVDAEAMALTQGDSVCQES